MCDVNVATGVLMRWESDVFLPGFIPVELRRVYKSTDDQADLLGIGWSSSLSVYLLQQGDEFVFHDENAQDTRFEYSPETGAWVNGAQRLDRRHDALVLDLGDRRLYRFFPEPHSDGILHLASIEDADGNTVAYSYEMTGALRTLVDTLGRRLEFGFDRRGYLATVDLLADDVNPRILRLAEYRYDEHDDLVLVTIRGSASTTYEYDDHLLVRQTDGCGRSAWWSYDETRRCTHTWFDNGVQYRRLDYDDVRKRVLVTNSLGDATLHQLDDNANITLSIDATGDRIERTYNAAGEELMVVAPGLPPQVTLFDPHDNCLTETDLAGRETKYYFTADNRLTRVLAGDGTEWLQEYDARGHAVRRVDAAGGTWRFEYARQGYATRVTNPLNYSVTARRTVDGTVTELADALGLIIRCEFNRLAYLVRVTNAAERSFSFDRDPLGRLTAIHDPTGQVRTCSYDTCGNIASVTDEVGSTFRFTYDGGSAPTRVTTPAQSTIQYAYDSERRLVEYIDWRGDIARFAYDRRGQLAEVVLPDGRRNAYQYDPAGELTSIEKANGDRLLYEYDSTGAVTRTIFPDGSSIDVAYENGRGVAEAAGDILITREFDDKSRMVRETRGDWSIVLEYDAMSNLCRVEEAGGRVTWYEYDGRRRLTSMDDSLLGRHTFTYDGLDLMIEWTSPGVVRRMTYDELDRMISLMATDAGGAVVAGREFEYDPADRLVRMVLVRPGTRVIREFTYDALHHLLTVSENGAVVERYDYDVAGNLVSGIDFANAAVASGDRLLAAGDSRFEYDLEGNRTRLVRPAGDIEYRYDAANRLIGATSGEVEVSLHYDGRGRLARKTRNGVTTEYYWLDQTLYRTVSSDGTTRDFLFLPSSFIAAAMSSPAGVVSTIIDQLGSPRELVDQSGALVWASNATAFGVEAAADEAAACPFGFQGQMFDRDLRLYYNRYRYYDPRFGRFLTQDPIGFRGSINLYTYVTNPVNWIDPLGLFQIDLSARCDWNDVQKEEFKAKVKRYNDAIDEKKDEDPPEKGLTIEPCERKQEDLRRLCKKCQEAGKGCSEPSNKTPKGKGKPTDCTQDIDHIVDVQMGGPQEMDAVCQNITPVNSSVNRSLGSQVRNQLKAKMTATDKVLEKVNIVARDCPDTSPRTPECS